ncbi:MAG: hypothetical protein H6Q90_4260 [Deltaproteobacteria bacterium]|nr:hypothetical protein [Deltaproteobacteria bacterium]
MSRLTSIAASFAAVTALGSIASAQSQAEIALKLNDEGKELMYGQKYAEASSKFREAVARVPEPKYFFNLCTSLFQEGKFGEALTACNAVANNNPSAELRTKSDKLTNRIKDEAKTQGINVEPVGGGGGPGDPNDCANHPQNPGCSAVVPPPATCQTNPGAPECQPAARPPQNPPPAVGRPPAQGLFTATTPDNKYTWTLGIDLFGGGGAIGQPDFYGSAAGGFRLKGDYLLNAASRLGTQAYLQVTHFGQGQMDSTFADTLDVIDVGIAAYKHLCPPGTQRLCLTPLAGVQLALMSPASMGDGTGSQVFNYAAIGARLEIGLQYAFGRRFEHVLGLQLGANVYSAVFSGPSIDNPDFNPTTAEVGLDKGGAVGYFGVGYTYRFNTPLGSSPFVTLE